MSKFDQVLNFIGFAAMCISMLFFIIPLFTFCLKWWAEVLTELRKEDDGF